MISFHLITTLINTSWKRSIHTTFFLTSFFFPHYSTFKINYKMSNGGVKNNINMHLTYAIG